MKNYLFQGTINKSFILLLINTIWSSAGFSLSVFCHHQKSELLWNRITFFSPDHATIKIIMDWNNWCFPQLGNMRINLAIPFRISNIATMSSNYFNLYLVINFAIFIYYHSNEAVSLQIKKKLLSNVRDNRMIHWQKRSLSCHFRHFRCYYNHFIKFRILIIVGQCISLRNAIDSTITKKKLNALNVWVDRHQSVVNWHAWIDSATKIKTKKEFNIQIVECIFVFKQNRSIFFSSDRYMFYTSHFLTISHVWCVITPLLLSW